MKRMFRSQIIKTTNWRLVLTIVILPVLLFLVGRFCYSSFQTYQEAQEVLEDAQVKYKKIQEELEIIRERSGRLETETGRQDYLVERKGLIRAGERVLILVHSQKDNKVIKEKKEKPWWVFW